ncbi:serine/threonine-protein kinase [Nonomuraea sp. NPDC050310]|uniref:serine/threonine-protein kinase n=1 Tax=Nonomuraea sp. NPDC050310 TaxID=3154935 RepID=UPI0033F88156
MRQNPGRRIAGRYHLQEPIGRGGMGIVWRAHDELLDRTVAVKEVRYSTDLGEEVQLLNRRTMREARAAARFEHPNVIVVYDVIEEDDQPWIVMQLVPSRSLGTVIKQDGPLPWKKVAEIGLAVLEALHSAHEAGVLHRDVKPENVLLADDGRVVLTDFGIATLETETQLTMTGLAGTPAFIAPERLKGLPARRESDLWSLGATLYAAVEGRAPHERGMVMATMHAVLNDEADPASKGGPLAPVITGLLVKEPDERLTYGDAARMLRDIVRRSQPPAAPPPEEDDMPTDPTLRAVPALPPKQAARRTPTPAPSAPETGSHLEQVEPRPAVTRKESTPPRELEDPTVTSRSGSRRVTPVIAVGAAVALVAGVGVWLGLRSADDPQASPKPSAAAATSTATTPPSAAPSTAGPSSAEPSATPESTPEATPSAEKPKDALPEGWKMYKDKTGFQVGLPKGWEEYKREGSQVFFRGPGAASNAFLAIDQIDKAGDDPKRDWEVQERGASSRFGGYKLVHIKKVDYMVAAADWEFTWITNSGKTRVRNRGFVTEGGMGYSIYWHNLDSRWKKDLHFFDTFAATFKPRK